MPDPNALASTGNVYTSIHRAAADVNTDARLMESGLGSINDQPR
jgi:hypothetical protein